MLEYFSDFPDNFCWRELDLEHSVQNLHNTSHISDQQILSIAVLYRYRYFSCFHYYGWVALSRSIRNESYEEVGQGLPASPRMPLWTKNPGWIRLENLYCRAKYYFHYYYQIVRCYYIHYRPCSAIVRFRPNMWLRASLHSSLLLCCTGTRYGTRILYGSILYLRI